MKHINLPSNNQLNSQTQSVMPSTARIMWMLLTSILKRPLISHAKLLEKLHVKFKISGSAWKFFRNLPNQTTAKRLNTQYSIRFYPCYLWGSSGEHPWSFIIHYNISMAYPPIYITPWLKYNYADDTKCGKEICSCLDCSLLQSDIDAISNWSKVSSFPYMNWRLIWYATALIQINPIDYNYLVNNITLFKSDQPIKT